jgi:hypothetical protein
MTYQSNVTQELPILQTIVWNAVSWLYEECAYLIKYKEETVFVGFSFSQWWLRRALSSEM